jgi:hypothetical protein
LKEQSDFKELNFVKAIVICKESGEYLLDLILDYQINPILLSSFVGALSLFGKDGLGQIKEITIKGLDLELIIINKHDLVFLAIVDKSFMSDKIREDYEKSLDMFYLLYKKDIEQYSLDTARFESFKKILILQIQEYFENYKEQQESNFGFLPIKKKNN